jgi:hypothetical protein
VGKSVFFYKENWSYDEHCFVGKNLFWGERGEFFYINRNKIFCFQALVHLIGGYRDGLKYRSGDKIVFSDEAFVRSRSTSIQPFLTKMLELQIFRQFIDERLKLLNSGLGFSDEFELECVAFSDRANKRLKHQYAAITQNVRKESGAFVKAVKSKTNPAVKDAVKTVKEGSKIAQHKARATYKDLKSRLRENREEIRDEEMDGSGGVDSGGGNTHSAPSSPVQSRSSSALGRYGTMTSNQFPRQNTDLNFSRVRKYERFDPTAAKKELSPDFEDLPRLEYDLMSDLEEVMSRGKAEAGLPLRNGSQAQPIGAANGRPLAAASIAASTFTAPTLLARSSVNESNQRSVRKPSVGDLINLEADEDTELEVVFDPLASHRKLSRTGGNPFATSAAAPSAAAGAAVVTPTRSKYENYTPPAGANQAQFKQFLSSMTDPTRPAPGPGAAAAPVVRSSDDLLSEYGLFFGKLSIQADAGNLSEAAVAVPGPRMTNVSSSFGNSALSAPVNSYPRPVTSSVQAAPLPPPRSGPPPPAPGRPTNSSFLYSSSQAFGGSDFFSPSNPAGAMPVNQRVPFLPGPVLAGDLLADLDPLRAPTATSLQQQQQLEVELSGIRPPAIPPRVKKAQWTTFE